MAKALILLTVFMEILHSAQQFMESQPTIAILKDGLIE
jgi:hypothetical protein